MSHDLEGLQRDLFHAPPPPPKAPWQGLLDKFGEFVAEVIAECTPADAPSEPRSSPELPSTPVVREVKLWTPVSALHWTFDVAGAADDAVFAAFARRADDLEAGLSELAHEHLGGDYRVREVEARRGSWGISTWLETTLDSVFPGFGSLVVGGVKLVSGYKPIRDSVVQIYEDIRKPLGSFMDAAGRWLDRVLRQLGLRPKLLQARANPA